MLKLLAAALSFAVHAWARAATCASATSLARLETGNMSMFVNSAVVRDEFLRNMSAVELLGSLPVFANLITTRDELLRHMSAVEFMGNLSVIEKSAALLNNSLVFAKLTTTQDELLRNMSADADWDADWDGDWAADWDADWDAGSNMPSVEFTGNLSVIEKSATQDELLDTSPVELMGNLSVFANSAALLVNSLVFAKLATTQDELLCNMTALELMGNLSVIANSAALLRNSLVFAKSITKQDELLRNISAGSNMPSVEFTGNLSVIEKAAALLNNSLVFSILTTMHDELLRNIPVFVSLTATKDDFLDNVSAVELVFKHQTANFLSNAGHHVVKYVTEGNDHNASLILVSQGAQGMRSEGSGLRDVARSAHGDSGPRHAAALEQSTSTSTSISPSRTVVQQGPHTLSSLRRLASWQKPGSQNKQHESYHDLSSFPQFLTLTLSQNRSHWLKCNLSEDSESQCLVYSCKSALSPNIHYSLQTKSSLRNLLLGSAGVRVTLSLVVVMMVVLVTTMMVKMVNQASEPTAVLPRSHETHPLMVAGVHLARGSPGHLSSDEEDGSFLKDGSTVELSGSHFAATQNTLDVPTVVFVGECGEGKSTIVEKITGKTGMSSQAAESSTRVSTEHITDCRTLRIVDTPGLNAMQDPMQHYVQIAFGLCAFPIKLLCVVVKARIRMDETVKCIGRALERYVEFDHQLCVCVTHKDEVALDEAHFRGALQGALGSSIKIMITGIHTTGGEIMDQMVTLSSNVEAVNLNINSDNFLRFFDIGDDNLQILRTVKREVAAFEERLRSLSPEEVEAEIARCQQRVMARHGFREKLSDVESGHLANLRHELISRVPREHAPR